MSALAETAPLALEVVSDGPLSDAERGELKRLERIIAGGITISFQTADALAEVHRLRLYRDRWPTFEKYLADRWGIAKSQGYRLVAASEAVAALCPPDAATVPVHRPTTEKQVRPLVGLPPEAARAAWSEAVDAAGGKPPTSRQVQAAVARVAPGRARPAPDPVGKAKAAGIIPADAEVAVFDPGPDADAVSPRGDTVGPDAAPLSDHEWAESLPAYARLADHVRPRFKADAVLFRHVTEARRKFAAAFTPEKNKSVKAANGWHGKYLSRLTSLFRVNDPSRWVPCDVCGGTGQEQLVGTCAECRGHGYHFGA